MKDEQPAGAPDEKYTMGYGQFVDVLKGRSLETHGKFIIPHLKPGMRVLDCGCGPGAIAVGLAEKVAPGEVVGVDSEKGQVELARELAGERGAANARFEAASLYELPFAGGSFDAAFVHNVLFHLGDPVLALREIRRVLEPGGFVGTSHTTGGVGAILYPPDERIAAEAESFARLMRHNGGSPRIGARQGAMLYEAGFGRVEMAADYFCEGTPEAVRAYAAMRAGRLDGGGDLVGQLVAAGIATKVELMEIRNAWRAWAERPGAFYAAPVVTAIGHKSA